MYKMKSLQSLALVLIAGLFLLSACNKTELGIQSPEKQFSMDKFQANLENGLGIQWAGYSFAINQGGQLKRTNTFGNRRSGNDGNVGMEPSSPMYGASLNKVMTAVAMLKILEEKGNGDASVWLNAKVYQFLPPNWTFGPNTDNITFKNLLEHRSGISTSAGIDYSDIRTLIATGTSADKSYEYANANYAILRILVARMSGNANVVNINDDVAAANATLTGFRRYIETKILDPLVIDMDTKPFGPSPALYYQWGNLNNGWNIGDMSNRLGNGGFYFTPTNFAKFMAYLNHSETIVSKATRDLMYQNFLGWSDGSQPQNATLGQYGRYYFKGGSFCDSALNGSCNGRGVRNIVASFPKNGVEVVFMGNTRGGNLDSSSGLQTLLRTAYDNAWE
jgi:D-alanyl-D-alanine carboxypeptidase